ncbi:MAG: Cytochrome c oxidase polypeptide I, partial [uncultured Acidimicrobiales bacterium]
DRAARPPDRCAGPPGAAARDAPGDGGPRLPHHDRPQAHRDRLPRHLVRLLPARRGAGAGDAERADRARPAGDVGQPVQPALHHARDDHDVPVHRALRLRPRQLPRPPAHRGGGHVVPAAQLAQLLALPGGRPHARRRVLDLGRPGGDRVDPVPAPQPGRVHPHHRHRPRPPRPRAHRLLRDLHGGERGDHRLHHAGAGDDDVPPAGLHLEHGRGQPARAHRVPDPDRRLRHALRRPEPRRAHLRPVPWRFRHPLAAPLLVLRAPRGVHRRPPLLRGDHRGHTGLLVATDLRLQGHRLRHARHRRPLGRGVGAPHVHHRRGAAAVLQRPVVPHRRPHRRQVLQLDRDDVVRPPHLPDADAVRHGLPRHLPARRSDGGAARLAPDRLPAPRHVLRGRPHALRAVRGVRLRGVRSDLPVVPQDDRAAAVRGPGEAALRHGLRRLPPHLPRAAPPRDAGHAEADRRLPRGRRLHHLERALEHGCVPDRHLDVVPAVEHRPVPAQGGARRGRPLGWPHPRVGHHLTSAPAELRPPPPTDPVEPAGLRRAPRALLVRPGDGRGRRAPAGGAV